MSPVVPAPRAERAAIAPPGREPAPLDSATDGAPLEAAPPVDLLQRTLGNQAVQDLARGRGVQPAELPREIEEEPGVEGAPPGGEVVAPEPEPAPQGEASAAVPGEARPAVDPAAVAAEVVLATPADGAPPPALPVGPATPAAWKGGLERAVTEIPAPALGDAGAADAAFRRRGFEFVTAQRAGQAAAQSSAAGLARRLPAPPAARREPLAYDPVPDATKRLADVSNKPLPEMTAPSLSTSPLGRQPALGSRAVRQDIFRGLTSRGTQVVAGLPADHPFRQEYEAARATLLPPAPETAPPVPGPPVPPIPAEPPRPPITLPPATRQDVAGVFARLLANLPGEAQAVLTDLLEQAYAGRGRLHEVFPDLGAAQHLPRLQSGLEARVRAMATDAGVLTEELNARIEDRRAEVLRQGLDLLAGVWGGAAHGSKAIAEAGQARQDAAAGARSAADRHAEQLRRAARRRPRRGEVPAAETHLLEATSQTATDQVTSYRLQGEARKRRLIALALDYKEAYRLAAQQDEMQLRTEAGEQAESRAVRDRIHPSKVWAHSATETVTAQIKALEAQVDPLVEVLQAAVREAATAKREAIRAWADARLGRERGDGERLLRAIADTASATQRETAAWAAVQNQRVSIGIAADLELVRQIQADVAANLDKQAILAARGVSQRQVAIIEAYFASGGAGPEQGLDAVVANVRAVFTAEQSVLVPVLEALVLTERRDDLERLTALAGNVNPDFKAKDRASQIRQGIDHFWGTDEDRLWLALGGLTPLEVRVLELTYATVKGPYGLPRDLRRELESDLSGRDEERAMAYLASKEGKARAIAARQAIYGNWEEYGLGTGGLFADTQELLELSRDGRQTKAMDTSYKEVFGSELGVDAESAIADSRDRERFQQQLRDHPEVADAITLRKSIPTRQEAYDRGVPPVADRDAVREVYARIRRELTAQAPSEQWTTSELEDRIDRRNRAMEAAFNAKYAAEYGDAPQGALRKAFDAGFQFSDADRSLAHGLADNDLARVDTALIEREREDLWSDKDALNNVLAAQYERALEATRRDQMPIRRRLMARELTMLEAQSAEPWTGAKYWEERERLQRKVDRDLEKAALPEAQANMDALRTTFHRETGEDLDAAVLEETSDFAGWVAHGREYDRDEAAHRLAQGGYLTPAQQVYYAIRGSGTREDALKAALHGRTAEEIKEIGDEFALLDHGRDMFVEIRSELSGRDRFDVDQLLKGTPETIQQRVDRLQEAYDYEGMVGPLGRAFAGSERQYLKEELERLKAQQIRMEAPAETPEQRDLIVAEFDRRAEAVEVAVAEHRAALDRIVEGLTTVVGVVVALGVGILTGGAGLALAATIASIAATGTNILLKWAVLGGQYGLEDLGVDVAVGVVDAVLAALTAGMGGKLLGIAEGPVGVLARAVKPSAVLQRMAQRGPLSRNLAKLFAEGAENLVANLPPAITASTLDDRNWEQGNALRNITLGALQQSATTVATAAGFQVGRAVGARALRGLGRIGGTAPPGKPGIELRPGRPSEPSEPGPDLRRAAPVDRSTLPADRILLDAPDLAGALPPRLLKLTPVSVDPDLPGRTVRIEYTRTRSGLPTDLRIVAGPDARPIDVVLHVPTLQAIRRWTGLLGRVLQARDALRRMVVENGPPRPGTRGWEARFELEKLPRVIASRMEELRLAGLDPVRRTRLLDELDDLFDQLARHERAITELRDDPGRGFVAAEGRGRTREPPVQRTGARQERADPRLERYPVANSPLGADYRPPHAVYQIGPSWLERHEGRLRRYRQVEVVDERGRVVDMREEILLLAERRWVQRGSEANVAGAVAEKASRRLSESSYRSTGDVDYVRVPKRLTQKAGGQGFDEVVIRFGPDGARIIVIEVKNYPDRYVPLADFTAVQGRPLRKNLSDLTDLIQSGKLGLTQQQQTEALLALRDRRMDLEIRLAPGTKLGSVDRPNSTVIADLRAAFSRGRPGVEVWDRKLSPTQMAYAKRRIEDRDGIGRTPRFYRLASAPGGGVETARLRPAQAATFMEGAPGTRVRGRLQPTDDPRVFADTGGGRLHVLDAEGVRTRPEIARLADDVMARLRVAPTRAPGARAQTQLVVDVTRMTPAQRAELTRALRARVRNGAPDLGRVSLTDLSARSLVNLGAPP